MKLELKYIASTTCLLFILFIFAMNYKKEQEMKSKRQIRYPQIYLMKTNNKKKKKLAHTSGQYIHKFRITHLIKNIATVYML